MNNRTRRSVLACGIILLAGIIVTVLARWAFGWEGGAPGWGKMGGAWYNGVPVDVTTPHAETAAPGPFTGIEASVDDGKVRFEEADRFEVELRWYGEVFTPRYEVQSGVLRLWTEKMKPPAGGATSWLRGHAAGLFYKNISVPGNEYVVRYPAGTQLRTASLKNNFGDAEVAGLAADTFTAEMQNGDIDLENLRCAAVEIENHYGETAFDNTAAGDFKAQRLTAGAQNGKMTVAGVRAAEISLTNSYGDVALRGCAADTLAVEMENGTMELHDTRAGKIGLRDDYGEARLAACAAGELAVEMQNGDLRLEEVSGRQARLINRYGGIRASGFTSDSLSIEADNGDIDIAGALAGATDIRDSYGSVRLALPRERAHYGLDLKSKMGAVRLDGKPLLDEDGGELHDLEENLDAADRIKVRCDNGDVRLAFQSAA